MDEPVLFERLIPVFGVSVLALMLFLALWAIYTLVKGSPNSQKAKSVPKRRAHPLAQTVVMQKAKNEQLLSQTLVQEPEKAKTNSKDTPEAAHKNLISWTRWSFGWGIFYFIITGLNIYALNEGSSDIHPREIYVTMALAISSVFSSLFLYQRSYLVYLSLGVFAIAFIGSPIFSGRMYDWADLFLLLYPLGFFMSLNSFRKHGLFEKDFVLPVRGEAYPFE